MIISHTNKFIFIKSIKTAGTSIEAVLSNYCSGDDVVTPLNDYSFNRDETGRVVHRAMNANKLEWWNKEIGQHVDAAMLKAHIPGEVWSTYKKISIARNPWDRLISLFMWRNKQDPSLKPKKRFYHWLGVPFDELALLRKHFAEYAQGDWETNDRFYLMDGELCADYVIRYEQLPDSFYKLCDVLGLPHIEIPRLKTGIRPTQYHYSRYYDENTEAIVAERHKNDIRLFGYEFENQQGT